MIMFVSLETFLVATVAQSKVKSHLRHTKFTARVFFSPKGQHEDLLLGCVHPLLLKQDFNIKLYEPFDPLNIP